MEGGARCEERESLPHLTPEHLTLEHMTPAHGSHQRLRRELRSGSARRGFQPVPCASLGVSADLLFSVIAFGVGIRLMLQLSPNPVTCQGRARILVPMSLPVKRIYAILTKTEIHHRR